jgi:hypothetical protein
MLVGVLALAGQAGAFTMGEQMATTGIQGTLARTSAPSASATIGSVKSNLAASTSRPALPGGASVAVPGGGRAGAPKSASARSGWGGSTQGWARQGAGKGGSWAGAGAGGAWAQSSGWPGVGNAWESAGKAGGGWARPGGAS